jgi:hypothetical protein|tara:strand:+ start:450 stop:665 length:216 start_codon:yes stop_codon:yes gene_type:complete
MKKNILNTLLIFFIIILLSFTMILFTNKSINVEKFNEKELIPKLEKDMVKFIKPTTSEYNKRFNIVNRLNN